MNIDLYKYFAFGLVFLSLFLPIENDAWILILFLAFTLLAIWIFKTFGNVDSWKYLAIIFLILMFLTVIGSTYFKWFLTLSIVSLILWAIKKYLLKD
ncbi:hypothetical protein GW932_01140 [archaeon]|nr:hypothetical protein [archaeon]